MGEQADAGLPRSQPAETYDEPDGEFTAALTSALRMLKGRATMMVGDGLLADDLVQDTYERACGPGIDRCPRRCRPG